MRQAFQHALSALALCLIPALSGAQAIVATVTPTNTTANVRWSIPGLNYRTDCTVTWFFDDVEVSHAVISEGLSSREYTITGLTASTGYTISIDCGLPFEIVNRDTFSTTAAPAGGNVNVLVSVGASIHPDAAQCRVNFGDTAATDDGVVEDTTCSAGGSITISVPRGLNYYKVCWETSGDVAITCGEVTKLITGDFTTKQLASSVSGGAPAVPFFAEWEARMTDAGAIWADQIINVYSGDDDQLMGNLCYYDGGQVYRSLALYTGDAEPWTEAATICKNSQEAYILRGHPSPTFLFVGGSRMDYWDFMDEPAKAAEQAQSYDTIIGAAIDTAWCSDSQYTADLNGWKAREGARCLLQLVESARLGYWGEYRQKRDFKYAQLRDLTDTEFFGPRTFRVTPENDASTGDAFFQKCPYYYYYQPFMMALLAYSFANDLELNPDDAALAAEIMPVLIELGDTIWADAWRPEDASKTLFYEHCQPNPNSPKPWQLNFGNTANPAWGNDSRDVVYFMFWVYSWLWETTGETRWRDHAHALMEGGVQNTIYFNGKHFNQTYQWSIEAMCYLQSPEWKILTEDGDQVLLEDGEDLNRQCRL